MNLNMPLFRFQGLLLLALLIGCTGEQPLVKEKGRWTEQPVQALYIVYEAQPDATEEQLKQSLRPRAREYAASHEFVVQVAVYDGDWADYLIQPNTQQRIMGDEMGD